MGCIFDFQNNQKENKVRKIYIDLLSTEIIEQPENICGNYIKTTRYTM